MERLVFPTVGEQLQSAGWTVAKKSKLRRMAQQLGLLQQVAALPYRIKGDNVEFLVITSRRRKRLIVPKGWPMPGLTDAKAAATEADEEAGVKGRVDTKAFASFEYIKNLGDLAVPVNASVFPLRVKKLKSEYKERKERKRKWMSAEEAADKLDDGSLRLLVKLYAEKLQRSEL